ncbi:hypothetical protein CesoFtcFv8_015327 [Champsocephalus esox]|uniref:Uncharacterized protein n=2 Tax=Champsocephalus TaxID=52236 RepID=A0AAN8DDR0_CHAGU|nr:hypothetical protein CesoFtcFv8_015327 [Champsocephalus esox]KAK5919810.1 hypothetical protein CgunFtcFv8_023674 [Champsocephalus gunnari]
MCALVLPEASSLRLLYFGHCWNIFHILPFRGKNLLLYFNTRYPFCLRACEPAKSFQEQIIKLWGESFSPGLPWPCLSHQSRNDPSPLKHTLLNLIPPLTTTQGISPFWHQMD